MTDANEALFVVRLPVGTKTVDFDDATRWIAQAKNPPLESLDEHGLDLFGAVWVREESELKASIERGDVEVLDSSYHAFRPPFTLRRLRKAVLTVKALRQYVQSINGAVEIAGIKTASVVAASNGIALKNKSKTTLIFEAKVIELMGKFWNERTPGTEPTKGDLSKLVYQEILRTDTRGTRKTTQSMVRDAAKPWKVPLVLPTFVRDSQFNEKRHPFKGDE